MNKNNEILVRKRTEKGLLSGLTEFPWNTDNSFPFENEWHVSEVKISHTFTHFRLTLNAVTGHTENANLVSDGFFVPINRLKDYPFSTLMLKAFKKAKDAHLV